MPLNERFKYSLGNKVEELAIETTRYSREKTKVPSDSLSCVNLSNVNRSGANNWPFGKIAGYSNTLKFLSFFKSDYISEGLYGVPNTLKLLYGSTIGVIYP